MALSYDNLWKLLIDEKIKKIDFVKQLQISNSTFAKLGKDEPVALTVLERICALLDCQTGDIAEYIPENTTRTKYVSINKQKEDYIHG